MRNPLKPFFRAYFHFSKKDRKGIIVLSVLIIIVLCINILAGYIRVGRDADFSAFKKALHAWEQSEKATDPQESGSLFYFNPNTVTADELDSFRLPDFIKGNLLSYRSAGGEFRSAADVRKIYGMSDSIFDAIREYIRIPESSGPEKQSGISPEKFIEGFFDPNKATAEDLANFGFNAYQAGNLLKYRKNGGSFHSPGDLMKIYGIDSVFFSVIEPHIRIARKERGESAGIEKQKEKVEEEVLFIQLNSADSADLVQLPGIGRVLAGRITGYRDLLGGFYTVNQLLEVYHLTDEIFQRIRKNIRVDTLEISRIRINFAGYKELIRHPYLNREQVETLMEYRGKNGSFRSVTQILEKGLLDSSAYLSIKPYLTAR